MPQGMTILVAVIGAISTGAGVVLAVLGFRSNARARRQGEQIDVIKVGQSSLMEALTYADKRALLLQQKIDDLELQILADRVECNRQLEHVRTRVHELMAELAQLKGEPAP